MDRSSDQGIDSVSTHSNDDETSKVRYSDTVTRILSCATMWHEEKSEMMLMLQAVAHMDADQSARRCAQKYLQIIDPDYYHFKTHIFFDDAFEISDDETEEMQVINRWVRQLCLCIDEACSNVHGVELALPPPVKTPTPYGGRLIYTLPGKTQIVIHLKDKSLIRHRKRWSQVMYMYYLLGYNLMEQPIDRERKEVIAENTYLLALDGDIDFLPEAVKLLVDLMKKNANLGAACGRIHPVGPGPMVWYQLFEYAIGHWFQKATEHMIGCVLCSPGCFSLFRARALMDDNVMKTYTTRRLRRGTTCSTIRARTAGLCTLLLQRGYRVELLRRLRCLHPRSRRLQRVLQPASPLGALHHGQHPRLARQSRTHGQGQRQHLYPLHHVPGNEPVFNHNILRRALEMPKWTQTVYPDNMLHCRCMQLVQRNANDFENTVLLRIGIGTYSPGWYLFYSHT